MDIQPEKIMLLGVPLNIVSPEELQDFFTSSLFSKGHTDDMGKNRNIVLLSLWDLLRARRNTEYRNFVFNAALVIPISKSLVSGVKFLTGRKLVRYMPFKFVVSLLTFLEKQEKSLYLLGSRAQVLKKTEKNIRSTFPRLKIVGRCEGTVRKQEEAALIEAVRKAAPSLLLAGKGIRGEELWLARNSPRLNSGLRLWCSDLFEVFAEKKRRPSDAVFERGLESAGYCLRNPLKIFRIFPYLWYKLLLLFYRFFRK